MNANGRAWGFLVTCSLALVAAVGCAAPMRVFVNRQADMTLYKKVVMVPFGNLSADPYASARGTRGRKPRSRRIASVRNQQSPAATASAS